MANKPFEIQGSTLSIGGVELNSSTDGKVVIPGVTRSTGYQVQEVNDTGEQTTSFQTIPIIIDYTTWQVWDQFGSLNGYGPYADYIIDELDDEGFIDGINVDTPGSYAANELANEGNDMYAYTGSAVGDEFNPFVGGDWTQIPFRPVMKSTGVESDIGGSGSGNQLVQTDSGNTFALMEEGDVVFDGEGPGGVDRGIVWQYGDNYDGLNSMIRQDEGGLTVRAYTENGGLNGGESGYSAPVNIVTGQNLNQKTWEFDGAGNLTFPDGTIQTTAYTGGAAVSKFVLVNVDGGVYGSDDGENWDGPFDTGISNGLDRVAVGPDKIVYIANGQIYYTTAWNVTPTLVTAPGPYTSWRQVRYFTNIDKFVIVGNINGQPTYLHSANGVTWTVVSLDNTWAGTLNGGSGYDVAIFTDIATNGTGFLLTTDNSVLGSFYTTSLTTLESIGLSEWLDDGMVFDEVLYSSAGIFTGWFAFGQGNTEAGDGWWYNDSSNPSISSFSIFAGGDVSQAFSQLIGYDPEGWSELTIGTYNGLSTIVISTGDGQILYWPAIPEGPWVVVPKPYTVTLDNFAQSAISYIDVTGQAGYAGIGEKFTITGSSVTGYNGTYYIDGSYFVYTDIERTLPFDTSGLDPFTGTATLTWSHGMYFDALNYANGKFYAANDSEEVFVSSNGGATWTQVASLNPEGTPGDGGSGPAGTDFMNDIDGYVGTSDIHGNFEFSNNTLINANGLILDTNRGVLAIGTNLEGVGGPTHFHIAFEGSNVDAPYNDLFLGDDFNYVKINGTYGDLGVTIQTDDRTEGSTQHAWAFGNDGQTTFPTLTVPISDNANPSGTGQTLKFSDSTQQAIIYGPASTADVNNAERIIIQGAPGYTGTTGEGGDVYLWAGPGGSSGGDGGDIKIRAGRGQVAGNGGYLNFQAGNSTDGNGGYINIESGSSTNGTGGNITIDANSGGQLALYTSAAGNITLNTAGGNKVWTFDAEGKTTLPGVVVNSTVTKNYTGILTGYGVSPSSDPSWTDGEANVGISGGGTVRVVITSGEVSAIFITDPGTNLWAIGDELGTIDGATIGGGSSITLTVNSITTPQIDLTKTINKLADGTYALEDGVEGQIMYLVPQTSAIGNLSNIFIDVVHARIPAGVLAHATLYPFVTKLNSVGDDVVNSTMCTLIFTDGYWQQTGGAWD